MKQTVYIETTIISYLTARPCADLVTRGHQKLTQIWWNDRQFEFLLYTSQFVMSEASSGDMNAASKRLEILANIPLVEIRPEVEVLANRLLIDKALPSRAKVDALHLAVAAVHGIQLLMTWNCRHLANATLRHTIENVCRAEGYEVPIICTPFELMGENYDPRSAR
jgi:predicted nucleic acid-binding protein